MKSTFKYILAVAAATCAAGAQAQVTESGYFVEDYTYRFQMNPAIDNSRSFFAMPVLGNLNLGLGGGFNVKDFVYNVNGKTMTFMHPSVDAATFLNNINDNTNLNLDLKLDLLSFGFNAFGGYNTFNVNTQINYGMNVPKALFSLMKEGLSNKTYDIGNFSANATAYAEVAFGHSRDITDDLRVGATVKVLIGGANLDANLRSSKLVLGEDAWTVTSDAEVHANFKGLQFEEEINETTGNRYVSDFDIEEPGIGGFGFAADLGIVYNPSILKDLTISAAILDLGYINWDNDMLISTNGAKTFTTDKYTFSIDENSPNNFEDQIDRMGDDLAALYELEDMGDQGSMKQNLASTLNIGVEYKFPLYRKLSFGALYTKRFGDVLGYDEFRISANLAPLSFLSVSANVGTGTFGTSIGGLLSIHCPGFNLFLGMDHIPYEISKEFIPLSSNLDINFGLNFLF